MICAPPTEASSNELADWLELEVLASDTGSAQLVALNQSLELDEDFEPEELDQENLVAERRLQQVASAIQERIEMIGAGYPFEIDATGSTLSLKAPVIGAACAYLFCLIVSNGAKGGLLEGDGPWVPDLAEARGLFQICATVAAAGYVEGPAFSVGWPRPDSSSFLGKLSEVYSAMRDGVVHASVPPGAPSQVKDDEIDVIAWKGIGVTKPGTIYFLGQAASGADWQEKSLKGRVDRFHGTWFIQVPASQVILGTIMPFALKTEAEAGDHEEQAVVEGRLRRITLEHGVVLFRHRLAQYVHRAIELDAMSLGPIERIDELDSLCEYVDSYRSQLRAAIETVS